MVGRNLKLPSSESSHGVVMKVGEALPGEMEVPTHFLSLPTGARAQQLWLDHQHSLILAKPLAMTTLTMDTYM